MSFDLLRDVDFGDLSLYEPGRRDKMMSIGGALQRRSADCPFTLVRWDMHRGNVLTERGRSIIVDWEA